MQSHCDRCGQPTGVTTMSRFNTEIICPICEDKEKAHPMYSEAHRQELEAVRRGDYHFPGIGKPRDL